MAGTMDVIIREMTIEDYGQVYELWTEIKGFGIRTVDDSREGVERFLRRNPTTSVVAVQNGRIIGNILCGHDGRTGCFYHVCVARLPQARHRLPHGPGGHGGAPEGGRQQDQSDRLQGKSGGKRLLEGHRLGGARGHQQLRVHFK